MKQQILTVWESREPLLFFPGEEKTVRFDCGDLGRNPRLFLRGEPANRPDPPLRSRQCRILPRH